MSKYFVHLYTKTDLKYNHETHQHEPLETPYLRGGLGSDSYYQLDGRNNVNNMINDGYQRMIRMQTINEGYQGFTVIKCDGIGHNERIIYTYPSEMNYESD